MSATDFKNPQVITILPKTATKIVPYLKSSQCRMTSRMDHGLKRWCINCSKKESNVIVSIKVKAGLVRVQE